MQNGTAGPPSRHDFMIAAATEEFSLVISKIIRSGIR
jgi:hypothetical protein